MEHFKSVLNRPEPEITIYPEPATIDLDINVQAPSENEVKNAISSMKKRKAAGIDAINAEILQADLSTSTYILTEFFRELWKTESIPDDWCKGFSKSRRKEILLSATIGEE